MALGGGYGEANRSAGGQPRTFGSSICLLQSRHSTRKAADEP